MRIEFAVILDRTTSSKSGAVKTYFKQAPFLESFAHYIERIEKFTPTQAKAYTIDHLHERLTGQGARLWICDLVKESRSLSSEGIAEQLERLMNSGVKELVIALGPANGFSPKNRELLRPHLIWNFGPLTLPHDLAAVVAAEQIYRAFSILRNLPYHKGH